MGPLKPRSFTSASRGLFGEQLLGTTLRDTGYPSLLATKFTTTGLARLAPDLQLLSTKAFARLTFRRDSGPLTCDSFLSNYAAILAPKIPRKVWMFSSRWIALTV